ncbi:hypothetical protein [Flagellimonas beolgyonensis]|uniref:hypothetical protein n=1 Tax=Flagellimonas beolgyonensis TaxID=864064 RepID=UPI003D65E059
MITTIAKLLIGTFMTLMAVHNKPLSNREHKAPVYTSAAIKDPFKTKAFEVLDNKCNVCHGKRNRRRVFTMDNMNDWSTEIYKQVFIKKRMPQGKKIKLTSDEYQDLLTWISSLKTN